MVSQLKNIFRKIGERGWAGRIVPIRHLRDLRESIRDIYEEGLLDEVLYHEQLAVFSFHPPADLSGAQSIMIVPVPTPPMRIFFEWGGERVPVVIPPTYVSYTPRTERVQEILGGWLREEGYRMAKPRLPLKTLAVRSGLAEYGRNNICYVTGMGSFLQLVAVFTDAHSQEDPWRNRKALDRCKSCVACLRLCPTGAITEDRFLIHAEECLTYHNEAAGEFPGWIDPSWHHCLIGCMRCQNACPENKPLMNWFDDRAVFSEQETTYFIGRVPFGQLPVETAMKIRNLQINEDYRMLCRNLSMIVGRSGGN